jgi:hypothetical protein
MVFDRESFIDGHGIFTNFGLNNAYELNQVLLCDEYDVLLHIEARGMTKCIKLHKNYV